MSQSQPRRSASYTLKDFAEKLPFLHPQPSTPRGSRDWSRDSESRRTSIGLPTPGTAGGSRNGGSRGFDWRQGHRRQLSLSSFTSPRRMIWLLLIGFASVFLFWNSIGLGNSQQLWFGWKMRGVTQIEGVRLILDGGTMIPLGTSVQRGGREVFWWEQFDKLLGYYHGRKTIVGTGDWVSEQQGGHDMQEEGQKGNSKPALVEIVPDYSFDPCYVDHMVLAPTFSAYQGLPQGFPAPLFGSHEEIGLRSDVCYDRINRFGPYGYGFPEKEGGLGIKLEGDTDGRDAILLPDYRGVIWGDAQKLCIESGRYRGPRTAFVIRTWHDFEYTPHHIMVLRAIVNELTLLSGGKYAVHFLIHVKDDTIPIWDSMEMYEKVLNSSLPPEFAGMGTLWSVAQMKLVYPSPFPEAIVNFSGDDIYKAYRSLHFPLQYFAEKHPEFEYFWEWEMDIRVTGSYLELLEQVTTWAEKQDREYMWEKSSQFFIPSLFNNSYAAFTESFKTRTVVSDEPTNTSDPSKTEPLPHISGPQLPESERLSAASILTVITPSYPSDIPSLANTDSKSPSLDYNKITDLITFSPLFDPSQTQWAFHDDITGYPTNSRPPTRAALITASRLSRRLLLTMHAETLRFKHTMFPEMFPASVALHYGYRAIYAPLPVYFDRGWPKHHTDEIFNNVAVSEDNKRLGMPDHGNWHFHGENGSVFGPGEHVFRGATWYSDAEFAGYLWRRWLGRENGNGELAWEMDENRGRMCLPMMVLHPIKSD